MRSILGQIIGSKGSLLLMTLIVTVTAVDSQFIRVFHDTDLGTPGNFHLVLFASFSIIASTVNVLLLRVARSNDTQARIVRPLLFRLGYVCTVAVQLAISFILFFTLSEMIMFHVYNKALPLLVVYLSHLLSAFILGMLTFTFIQWFRTGRSFSVLIYGIVFVVILFLILITLPLLTEQFRLQPQDIYPRSYLSLILDELVPSPDIAFIYGLGIYVLPVMVIASWILTVSLLKAYVGRIGKKKFWLIVSIPLVYEIFLIVASDPDSVRNLGLVDIVYSTQFQLLVALNGQVSGLFFAIAFWIVGRKTGNKDLKNFFIISSLGVISLFSSLQPGSPFYAAYPPFGLVTLLFLGLSSYMLLVGMVGSAAYVSRNSEVRREVYKGLESDSHFLQMGVAEMQREIQRRVLTVVDKIKSSELSDEMKISTDPDEEDVQMMIEQVLNEVRSKGSHFKRLS